MNNLSIPEVQYLDAKTDRKVLRDQFFARFRKLPSEAAQAGDNMELYAAVAAKLYKSLFPNIARSIEEIPDNYDAGNISPKVIKGTGFGYVKNIRNTSENKRVAGSHRLYEMSMHGGIKDKALGNRSEAHHLLGLTMASLLGGKVDRFYLNSDLQDAQSSEPHSHQEYTAVIGLGDAKNVRTHILDEHNNSLFGIEINRGDVFIFPPDLQHKVDDLVKDNFSRSDNEGHVRTRKTFAYFIEPSESKFSDEEIKAAEEKFLYSDKELASLQHHR